MHAHAKKAQPAMIWGKGLCWIAYRKMPAARGSLGSQKWRWHWGPADPEFVLASAVVSTAQTEVDRVDWGVHALHLCARIKWRAS